MACKLKIKKLLGKRIVLTAILVLLVIFPLMKVGWQKKDFYLAPFDLERTQDLYGISQYVKGKDAAWIADEILFTYAGWHYINGGNPILVNPENPPLGKYLIGLSIKFFDNEKVPSLAFALLSLFSLYLLSRLFLKKTWLALFPVVIFGWGKLFQEQLIYLPLFETFALTFLCFALYFFIKAQDQKNYFFLSSFFLGVLWATRPWMATIPLLASWGAYLLVRKETGKIITWLVSLPVALVVLLLSYTRLFWEGWSIYKVLSVQKWILWYHQSRLIKFGSVWPFIYLRRWYAWWGDEPCLPVAQWNLFWPIFTTLALVFSLLVFLKTLKPKLKRLKRFQFDERILILCLWIIFYLAFLSIGNINSRYVFYLLPFCYLLGIYFLKILVKLRFHK